MPLPGSLLLPLVLAQAQDSLGTREDSAASTRVLLAPVVSYSDVTGIQVGIAASRSFRTASDTSTRTSSDVAYLGHTAKGHGRAVLQLERWSPGNERRVRLKAEYQSYPLPYFGIGPGTPDTAMEWYSSGVSRLHVFDQRMVRHGDYLMAGIRATHSRLRETEPGRALDGGAVPGASGGPVVEVEGGVIRDTRDGLGTPARGSYARLIVSAATRTLGSEYVFRRLTLDARRYATIAGGHVAAGHVQLDAVDGAVPFDQLPMIGADTAMRGYDRGRYRDRVAATAQVELRTTYWRRVGLAAFAGVGTVAPRAGDLLGGPWYPSVGAGLRALLLPASRTVGRLDVGFGRRSIGVNIGLGEAF